MRTHENVRVRLVPMRFACALAIVAMGSCVGWSQDSCTPPDSMKARFTGKPNAAALNELGAWFGGQKNYSCAADAFAASLQQDPKQPDFAHVAFMFGASLYYAGDNKE